MKVLVVPDKFKGTLRAAEAAACIQDGWHRARPDDEISLLPMSDGGDGFGEVLGGLAGATRRASSVVDAAGRARDAAWWFASERGTAIVETAESNGLALLPAGEFHPFDLDTRGVGELLLAASAAGAEECIAGIGGSATNDGGFGMARALGWRFLNAAGGEISRWVELDNLHAIERPERLPFARLIVANDVQNPLLGPAGASRIYGPQKGLRAEDFAKAEACLGRLAEVSRETLGRDDAVKPGAGAAGGLGFGLAAFAEGVFQPGFDLFADRSHLKERIRGADLVVSAEGGIDAQTAMGKGVGGVAVLCRGLNVPCVGMAGALLLQETGLFTAAYGIFPHITTLEKAKGEAAVRLRELACHVANEINTERLRLPGK